MSTAKIIRKLQDVCYRDEPNSGVVGDINYFIKGSKFFELKTNIARRLEVSNTEKKIEIFVPLKQLSNIWRTIDMSLINCGINLILAWSENYVITSKAARDVDPVANPAVVQLIIQRMQHLK